LNVRIVSGKINGKGVEMDWEEVEKNWADYLRCIS